MDRPWMLWALFFSTISPSLSGLIPGFLTPLPPNPVAEVPVIGGIADAVPAVRNIPGLSFIPKPAGMRASEARTLNNAIEQFSTPLIRITSGDSLLLAQDFDQMLSAIPKLVLKPTLDLSQLSPELRAQVYRGEPLLGFPKETVDEALREHILRVYEAALKLSTSDSASVCSECVNTLDELPTDIVTDVMNGARLPYLSEQEMKVVKEYYVNKLAPPAAETSSSDDLTLADIDLSPELFKVLKLLPENYDFKKIPKEVIQSVSRGELPNLALLPQDLQQHFMTNFRRIFAQFSTDNLKVEDVLSKLPNFERVEVTTFTPYDLKFVSKNGVKKEFDDSGSFRRYALIAIGVVSVASVVILTTFCILLRRKKSSDGDESLLDKATINSYAESTPRVERPKLPQAHTPTRPIVFC